MSSSNEYLKAWLEGFLAACDDHPSPGQMEMIARKLQTTEQTRPVSYYRVWSIPEEGTPPQLDPETVRERDPAELVRRLRSHYGI